MSQKKSNIAREERRVRNKAKKMSKLAKGNIFQSVRKVVSAQKQLDENAKKLGILEETPDESNKENPANG
jgi:cytochrome c556